jgi:hypothetical protein
MNKRLAVFATTLTILLGSAIFIWKQKTGIRAYSHTQVSRADSVQRPEDAVISTYRLLEKANREGNGALLLSLQSREALSKMSDAQKAEFPKSFPADPGLQYVPLAVGANGSHGVVIGRMDGSATNTFKYEAVKFLLEDGAWKVDVESMSDSPLDPRGLYALLPPADGAFIRAGSPWASIPYANSNTKFFKEDQLDWKMQATQDESFLYIRFEAKAPLPAPQVEVPADNTAPGKSVNSGAPSSPPVMKIKISEAAGGQTANVQEFSFHASDVIQTRATFDEKGKANSNRFFVVYSLTVRDPAEATIFDSNTDETFSHLVAVQDRFLELKIPLKSLGLEGKMSPAVALEEANSLAKILPYQVVNFQH